MGPDSGQTPADAAGITPDAVRMPADATRITPDATKMPANEAKIEVDRAWMSEVRDRPQRPTTRYS